MGTILEVKNLSVSYGGRKILDNISFNLEKGEIVLLKGRNGSGKTTLLNAIFNLFPKKASNNFFGGNIFFNNENITNLHSSLIISKGMLYLPQGKNVFEDLTVEENLQLCGLSLNNKKLIEERKKKVYKLFPSLKKSKKRIPMKMSGGERQVLILGMVTMHTPLLMLLDEPSLGLSKEFQKQIINHIQRLNRDLNISFLIIEHKVEEFLPIADRLLTVSRDSIYEANLGKRKTL